MGSRVKVGPLPRSLIRQALRFICAPGELINSLLSAFPYFFPQARSVDPPFQPVNQPAFVSREGGPSTYTHCNPPPPALAANSGISIDKGHWIKSQKSGKIHHNHESKSPLMHHLLQAEFTLSLPTPTLQYSYSTPPPSPPSLSFSLSSPVSGKKPKGRFPLGSCV